YRIRAKKVGTHQLDVTATAGDFSDRIRKEIDIVPDGQRVEVAHGGTLREPASVTLTLPKDAIEGSAKAFVKIYPSTFSQLVERLLQVAYGLLRQNVLNDFPKHPRPRLPEAHRKEHPEGGGEGAPLHPPRLPAAPALGGAEGGPRLVRPPARQCRAVRLRADG